MQKILLKEAEKYAKQNHRQRAWRKVVRVMACVVVFCTTYALILPAITMEKNPCDLEEHTHGESCYEKVVSDRVTMLACTYEALGVHVHTSDCYDGANQLICGQADYLIHEHNSDCIDENGAIVCQIPEVSEHEHIDTCYAVVETETDETEIVTAEDIHVHGDDCYATQRGDLICQISETEGHTHGQTCFTRGELLCQLTEQEGHTHGEGCSETVLVCSLEVEPHVHGDGCYRQLVCERVEDENHAHSEECTGTVLICDVTEQPHTHTDACYETRSLCDLPETEGHTHGTDCYESLRICTLSEEAAHEHIDVCYETVSVLICELEENVSEKVISLEEPEPLLICEKEIIKLHSHDDTDCYETYLDENGSEQKRLICTEIVVLEHVHGESCFANETVTEDSLSCTQLEGHVHVEGCYDESGTLICTETESHIHGEMCYGTWELICGKEEHVHDAECTAALETSEENKEAINELRYTGTDYEVILRFDELAEIPVGAELVVTELTGEAYRNYLERTYEAVGHGGNSTLVQVFNDDEILEVPSEEVSVVSGAVSFARFFDLTILVDGEEIEPKDTVEVTIRYDETVSIPDGEKTAVHFTHDGEVEVLNAESVMPMMLMSARSDTPAEETENNAANAGGEFVFFQDSFSVTGTVTLDTISSSYEKPFGQTISTSWPVGELRTISIMAGFEIGDSKKSITVKVPTGYTLKSYSAVEGIDIDGVQEISIDKEFVSYVQSSELGPASLQNNIAGVAPSTTWAGQVMTGYATSGSSQEQNVRTHGGDIFYQLTDDTQKVLLVLTLEINHRLLSHTASSEAMEPIQIIASSAAGSQTTKIAATATEIPVITLAYGDSGGAIYRASEIGAVDGRSAAFPVAAKDANTIGDSVNAGSYIESGTFTLTYPAGVFLEPGTVDCGIFRLVDIQNLTKNGITNVNNHLSIEWFENENGGGHISWVITKKYIFHNESLSAEFTANTDPSISPCFKAGDTITGFTMTGEFTRNGKTRTISPLTYTRVLTGDGDGKDIRVTPQNYTRRDITTDFRTEQYDYALGGFTVFSFLNYQNNTFYFENPEGLKITALDIMHERINSSRIRNVTYWTNTGNKYFLSEVKTTTHGDIYVNEGSHGYHLALSKLGGKADEYITAALFTVDLQQGTNYPHYTTGSFVYYGQFQDGDDDGSREGDVTLRQLWDNTTAEQVEAAVAAGALDGLVYINAGSASGFAGKPVAATDHTKIGWTNTGAGGVTSSVANANGESGSTFGIGDRLQFQTRIHSATVIQIYNSSSNIHQDMVIDPVLVISLPEGISLDLTSVKATSAAGNHHGNPVTLVQDGAATTKVINQKTWTTYRFKSPQMLDLVAKEYFKHPGYVQNIEKSEENNYITATFDAMVDPGCGDLTLSLADVMMWDIRNTAYEPDTLGTVSASGENGDAIHATDSDNACITDTRNLMGHGTKYRLTAGTGEFAVKPEINLYIDLGIKPVTNKDDIKTSSGFTTYNGLQSSVVPVIPGRYADVQVTYLSTSNTPYYQGTSIYVPIPKHGEDYEKYFENIQLDNPFDNEAITKTFGYTMDLTGPVTLTSSQGEQWTTYYALRTVKSNPNDLTNDNREGWEPVVNGDNAKVKWLTESEITDWSQVAMIKFVATAHIEQGETGEAIMRLYVHNVKEEDGPALAGTYNYWRGYGKAVIVQDDQSGNWKYTSVVAATPAVETLLGQIFIDEDQDGIWDWDSGEPRYTPGTKPYAYTVELKIDDGAIPVKALTVNSDGFFALLADDGNPEYLPAGSYTLTVRRNADPNFLFANSGDHIGKESPGNSWSNNVSSSNGTIATWTFTVQNSQQDIVVHRVGVGLKPSVSVTFQAQKTYDGTLKGHDFTFALNQGSSQVQTAKNLSTGAVTFDPVRFEHPGTYTYTITEDRSNPIPGINYDGHATTVTVTVTRSDNGALSAKVTYDNSTATTAEDQSVKDKAAFTNVYGYELPETGGAGTTSYTMVGLLLMLMAAAISLYIHSKKRRKEAQSSF